MHTTLGRTPLGEWSARRRYLYLTTYNTYKRQTSIPPAGFEHESLASEQLQNHALDRAGTGIGCDIIIGMIKMSVRSQRFRDCSIVHIFY
jgi:hypothetical protein